MLLDRWKEIHESEFGLDAAHDIPDSSQFGISKMGKGGAITADTCNPACLLIYKLATHMTEVPKERAISDGEDRSDVLVQKIECHNNPRNFWIGAITKRMSS